MQTVPICNRITGSSTHWLPQQGLLWWADAASCTKLTI
jgi:hypothetical protein